MRISLAPIFDFFLNCYSPRKKWCFLQKKFFDLTNIKKVMVASAHTQYSPQQLWRILSTRPSSFGAYSVHAPAASAHTQYMPKLEKFFGQSWGAYWAYAEAAGARTEYAPKQLRRILSTRSSSFGAYSVCAPAASAHTQYAAQKLINWAAEELLLSQFFVFLQF